MQYSVFIAILLASCNAAVQASSVLNYDIGDLCTTHTNITLTGQTTLNTISAATTHTDITLTGQTTLLTISAATMTFPHNCHITVHLPSIKGTWLQYIMEPYHVVMPCGWISTTAWTSQIQDYHTFDVCGLNGRLETYSTEAVGHMTVSVQHNGSTVNMTASDVSLLLSPNHNACFEPTERCHDADTCRDKVQTDCEEVMKDCPFLCVICHGKAMCNCDVNDTTPHPDYVVCNPAMAMCIHPDMVCDGYANCYGGEDEGTLCDMKRAREMASGGSGWGGHLWVGVVRVGVSGWVVWVWSVWL